MQSDLSCAAELCPSLQKHLLINTMTYDSTPRKILSESDNYIEVVRAKLVNAVQVL